MTAVDRAEVSLIAPSAARRVRCANWRMIQDASGAPRSTITVNSGSVCNIKPTANTTVRASRV